MYKSSWLQIEEGQRNGRGGQEKQINIALYANFKTKKIKICYMGLTESDHFADIKHCRKYIYANFMFYSYE